MCQFYFLFDIDNKNHSETERNISTYANLTTNIVFHISVRRNYKQGEDARCLG
jgi:hypothetical protein